MAQKWVSFEEVKSRVSMKDVLAHYALKTRGMISSGIRLATIPPGGSGHD